MTWLRLKSWFARKRAARLHSLAERWLARAHRWKAQLDQAGHRARDGPA